MKDRASCHQGVAAVRKEQLKEFGWEGWCKVLSFTKG
jgi:hypothetical protein